MIYFLSDTHFSDSRYNLLGRPFTSVKEMNDTIVKNYCRIVSSDDTVYFLGDLFGPLGGDPSFLDDLPGKKHLILGDYDTGPKADPSILQKIYKYFESVSDHHIIPDGQGSVLGLVHKPEDALSGVFSLTGHAHSTWRIQRNMINVGVDVWHFRPVSLDRILQVRDMIRTTYDINIFAGELSQNKI